MSLSKIEKLKERLSCLKSRLLKEKMEEHRKFENLGWGAGMRRSKLYISSAKSDRTEAQITKVEKEIERLEFNILKL